MPNYELVLFNKRTGEQLQTVYHNNKNIAIVEKEDMQDPFFIRVYNRNWERAVAVVSVDGLSVMDGQEAGKNDSGYILDKFEHYDILGWRRGNNAVAEFVFTGLQNSYAALTNRPNNVGVIGAWFWQERIVRKTIGVVPRTINDNKYRVSGSSKSYNMDFDDCEYACSIPQGVGAGYGQEVSSQVRTEHFNRAPNPVQHVLYYNTRKQLKQLGVILPVLRSDYGTPVPFPKDEGPYTPEPPVMRKY